MKVLSAFLEKHPKKHIIFDFDETLYWLHCDRSYYKHDMRTKLSEINPELYATYEWWRTNDMCNAFIQRYWSELRDEMLSIVQKTEAPNISSIDRNPELLALLDDLKDRLSFHIWSSNLVSTFEPVMKKEWIRSYFTTLMWRDTVELTKWYADGFYKIYEQHGWKRWDYLMVGNSLEHDKVWSERAGIDFVHVDPSKVAWEEIDFTYA